MMEWSLIYRSGFALLGGMLALLEPTLPYALIFTLAVLYDCISAWQLGKRVAAAHPDKAHEWRFTSIKMARVFGTLLKGYAMIILAYFVTRHITDGMVDMTKVVSGALVFWQVWSILENESSCNGSAWAKLAQKILVDKTSRHFDVDLSDLNKDDEND